MRDRRPDALRRRLRRGDPALDDPGPNAMQVAEMRRAMQRAALERRAVHLPRATLAAALAVVVLAALVAAGLWWPSDGESPVRVTQQDGGPPVEAETPSPPTVAMTEPEQPGPVRSEATPTPTPGEPDRDETRTIRFTTSSGTQVIWTLDPRFALPAPVSDVRGENS